MKSNKIERIAYNMGDKSKKKILIFLAISNRTAEGYCVYACCFKIGLSFICSTPQVYFCFVCLEEDQGGLTYMYMYIIAKDILLNNTRQSDCFCLSK